MRYLILISLAAAGCQTPNPNDPTLVGINNVQFESRLFSTLQCGQHNTGGTFTGNHEGHQVKGDYCCTVAGCYYRIN